MSRSPSTSDVLTLEELARYLRVPPDAVEQQALQGRIPGRKIRDDWRFHRSAVDEWLRLRDGRTIVLRQWGALRDDETLAGLRTAVYAGRGRPEVDPGGDP